MNVLLLKEVCRELDTLVRGAAISKIKQPDEKTLLVEVFLRGGQRTLLISTHPEFARIHLTAEKFKSPPSPPRFAAFLRSRIEGAVIEGVFHSEGERIVKIRLLKRAEGCAAAYSLLIELIGKSANIILLDDSEMVLDAMRYFREADARRPVEPGIGLKPLSGGAAPLRSDALPERKTDETWNEAAERIYAAALRAAAFDERVRSLKNALNEALKKAGRKLENLIFDKARFEKDEGLGRLGELILANFGAVKKGASSAEVTDVFSEEQKKIAIPLDPALGPGENADKYFKRSRKARAALKLLSSRIPETEAEIKRLAKLFDSAEAVKTTDDAGHFEKELIKAGIKAKNRAKAARPGKDEPAEPVERLVSSDGFTMLRGKNGKGNDLLVKKHARAGDLWFHAKDSPGAHVLVVSRGKKVPDKTIAEAARIAARHSKLKDAAKAEVLYADAKDVSKPKGAKPGMVTVARYKAIVVKI